jgi:hypothetical protein
VAAIRAEEEEKAPRVGLAQRAVPLAAGATTLPRKNSYAAAFNAVR